jgi:phosphate starvation-inducible membrane PsiE
VPTESPGSRAARKGSGSDDHGAGGRTAGPVPRTAGVAPAVRERIAQVFTLVEDVVYIGLGAVLAVSAVVLLGDGILGFGRHVVAATVPGQMVALLDRVLLILMIVEILYTVQVSFREHSLAPEPFLIVGLIAVTRRMLVRTAEVAELAAEGGQSYTHALVELALLTGMVLVLVVALVIIRKRAATAVADRA